MLDVELTPKLEQCMRDQVISDDQPGSVLRDFQMLLDFVGSKGLQVSGKYQLLPMKFIQELDQRLSRPLNLNLKRPQLRSHPYLQGLYLLLRASGLGRVEGSGSKARLVLDPFLKTQWDQLNPTERYFQLLEAWLRFGRGEMVGERSIIWDDHMVMQCLPTWGMVVEEGDRINSRDRPLVYLPGIGRDYYLLALMDLFGLLKVEHPSGPVETWAPTALATTPFGNGVFVLLWKARFESALDGDGDDKEAAEETGNGLLGLVGEDDYDWDDEPAEVEMPEYGLWQPLFQPYFPDWQQNLTFPEVETREGTFVFRVSLGRVWRLIAMPAEATLDDLMAIILESVDFDFDHLYEFSYRDYLGRRLSVFSPQMDEGPWTTQVRIDSLPLEPGQTMDLLYDFGDSWPFSIKLERVEPEGKLKKPKILEHHGKAPEQYPSWDE